MPGIHIAAICGSMRGPESFTLRVLKVAADAIRERGDGDTVDLIDLGELVLPLRNGPDDRPDHPATVDLKARVKRADAILLASPEYHNSFSGVLKNALDLLSSEELRGKLFGLLGVGGGEAGAINTLGHLRYVVRGVGGWSLPAQVSIANAWKAFDGDRLKDPDIDERLRFFVKELCRFARFHSLEPRFEARLMQVIDEEPE